MSHTWLWQGLRYRVIFNANQGKDKPPRKRPYQARVTELSTNEEANYTRPPRFASAEEATLERAKLVKSHPNKYK